MKALPPRLNAIDGLKVVMLICVLLNHVPQYVGITTGDRIWEGLGGGFGVSGFVILSGFGLAHGSLSKNKDHVELFPFFWRRFVRIVPLYYVALFTASWILEVIQPKNLLTHLLFIHTFFEEYSHTPGSLWFIGLIVQCYFAFPLLYKLLRKERGKQWLLLTTALLYGLSLVLQHLGFYTIDLFIRFSLEFAFGMVLAANLHEGKSLQLTKPLQIAIVSLVPILFLALLESSLFVSLPIDLQIILRTFSGICFFALALSALVWIETHWRSFQKLVPLISTMSFASYAAYLFHRPILDVITDSPAWQRFSGHLSISNQSQVLVGNDSLAHAPLFEFAYLLIISTPIIFLVGYWIQVAHDTTLKDMQAYLSSKKEKKVAEKQISLS